MNHGITEEFEIFWKAYPQKKGRAEAERWWLKYKPDLSAVLGALELQKEEKKWLELKKMFVPCWPYGSTWVHGKRWTDGFCIEFEEHLQKKQKEKTAWELKKNRYRELYTETIKNASTDKLKEALRDNILMINQNGQRSSVTNIRWLILEILGKEEIAKL